MNANDFYFEVARGARHGFSSVQAFGTNLDVDTPEDVWAAGGTKIWHSTVQSVEIVSASTEDVEPENGAWTVLVEGLDANYELQSEIVAMNGTTVVPLVNQYTRINHASVLTAGALGGNRAIVTIRVAGGGDIFTTMIAPINNVAVNESNGAYYTVPAGHRFFLTSLQVSNFAAATIWFGLNVISDGIKKQHFAQTFANVGQSGLVKFDVPVMFPSRTDIILRVFLVGAANQNVSGIIQGILVADDAV
jgi:hypothetical protein